MQKVAMDLRYEFNGCLAIVSMGTVVSGYISSERRKEKWPIETRHPQLTLLISDWMLLEKKGGNADCRDVLVSHGPAKSLNVLLLPEYFAEECVTWFARDERENRRRPTPFHLVLPNSYWLCYKAMPGMTMNAEDHRERAPVWMVVEEAVGFSNGAWQWSGGRWYSHHHFTAFHGEDRDAIQELLTAALKSIPESFNGRHEPRGYWDVLLSLADQDIEGVVNFLLATGERTPLINRPEELL